MTTETPISTVLGIVFGSVALTFWFSGLVMDARRERLENDFCTKGDKRGGGRLVRGQSGSFVCIDPKGVKWERK
ncbi:MAG TPA: hypothetical protein VGB13_04535 [Candidatus Krumholzibacteria bacterium]